ncbi:MAG: T9SS type A sorting domain-containing protein [Bacteroidota bacterium]
MKQLLLLSIIIFSVTYQSNAQNKKTLLLDKVDTICTNTSVDFNVRAKNFTNIIGFQGSIGWDSTIITFDSLMYGSNTGSINLNDSNTNIQPAGSYLNFVWVDSFAQTVPDNTVLFTLRFIITNPKGNKTPVYFNKSGINFTPLEIDTLNLNTLIPEAANDTAFINGYIGFVDTPKIFQNGNVLTCLASCNPSGFQWYLNGNVLIKDTSNSIVITTTGNYSVSVMYSNGNKVNSTSVNVILPLEILSLDASYENNVTNIKWKTAEELGTAYFNIGRKVNEGSFQTIATINTKGNLPISEYEYIDKDKNRGVISYQLEIVNKDGAKHYSRIITVNPKSDLSYKIYPNPAHSQIKVEGENITQIDIIDNLGHLLIRKRYAVLSTQSLSTKTINTNGLLPGAYNIKIYNLDRSSKVDKIVIN